MTSAIARAQTPADPDTFIFNDMAALASHMEACKRSRGRFFPLRSAGDALRGMVSSRIVSTGALVIAVGLVMVLAFG